jgi:hypothetical protein
MLCIDGRKMQLKPLRLKWLGVDYGMSLMSPYGLRNELNFGSIMKDLGKPEQIAEKIHRYRRLKEKYGSYNALKQGHREEILEYVFDGDQEAMDVFTRYETELLIPGKDVVHTLPWLRDQGIVLDIVAEGIKTLGRISPHQILIFLAQKRFTQYFRYIFTPLGRIDLADSKLGIDLSCQGKTKEAGTLWDYLVDDLTKQGFKINECAIIGDRPLTDIEPTRKRGFRTIQFAGIKDWGNSPDAEYKIYSWSELRDFVVGVK